MFDVKNCGYSNVKEEKKMGNVYGATKEQQTKEWLAEKANATLQRLKTNPKTREFVAACFKFVGSSSDMSITADSFNKFTNGDPVEAEKFYAMSKKLLQRMNQILDKWDLEAQNKRK